MAKLQSLLDLAESQVGYPEKDDAKNLDSMTIRGTKNYTKYSRDIDKAGLLGCQGQAWCGTYQGWLELNVFDKETLLNHLGSKFYSCFSTRDWAKSKGKWMSATGTPKPGYRVIFSQSHVALVTKVTGTYENGKIYTNEGNTSDGQNVDRDGGRVCNKAYARNYNKIQGYIMIDYDDEANANVTSKYTVETSGQGLKVTAALNVRSTPGGAIVMTYPVGRKVFPKTKCFVNGDAWLEDENGWFSGKYVDGWIQEVSDASKRWWYVKTGYKYAVSEWMDYMGKWYYLDKDGWMVTEAYVQSVDDSKKDVYYWLDKNGVWNGKGVNNPDLKSYRLAK